MGLVFCAHKIREALRQRDEQYKLKDIIELDGAVFGRRETGNQTEVLVAIESKDWIDEKGRKKSKAGFAKVMVAHETKKVSSDWPEAIFLPNGVNFRHLPAEKSGHKIHFVAWSGACTDTAGRIGHPRTSTRYVN
jgi:hypothetical protein